jgi:phosphoserine phosphatase
MKRELVIFDVCNTLYDSNTTFEFIRFVLERKFPAKLFYFHLLTKRISPLFIYWTIIGKLQKKDILRNEAVRLLRGVKKDKLLDLANDFYQSQLRLKAMSDILQLLEEKKLDNEVWLFSNSIDPVIQAIATNLKVNYVASELEYDSNDMFTGHFKRDLSGKKQVAFKELFETSRSIEMMCSDNKSDLEILKLAKKPVVIIYKSSDRAFWQSLNPVFIEKY